MRHLLSQSHCKLLYQTTVPYNANDLCFVHGGRTMMICECCDRDEVSGGWWMKSDCSRGYCPFPRGHGSGQLGVRARRGLSSLTSVERQATSRAGAVTKYWNTATEAVGTGTRVSVSGLIRSQSSKSNMTLPAKPLFHYPVTFTRPIYRNPRSNRPDYALAL
jgi:hypothetical protein